MMNGVTFDEKVFARMMALAESVLEKAEPLPGTQAIVLETVAGNEFAAEIPDALSESHVYEGALLEQLDVLVDGRFELAKKDIRLRFRGSSNQRILDVPASLASGRPVEKEMEDFQ